MILELIPCCRIEIYKTKMLVNLIGYLLFSSRKWFLKTQSYVLLQMYLILPYNPNQIERKIKLNINDSVIFLTQQFSFESCTDYGVKMNKNFQENQNH